MVKKDKHMVCWLLLVVCTEISICGEKIVCFSGRSCGDVKVMPSSNWL